MPRSFNESRWLQKFADLTLKVRAFSVCGDVWKKRWIIPYPDVIRARVLMLALEPVKGTALEALQFGRKLDVEDECLWNYFTRDVEGWVIRMEQRLGQGVVFTPPPKRLQLSQRDLLWIASFLKTCTAKSWADKLRLLRGAAYNDPEFKRLCQLPRSTLWHLRKELEIVEQFANQERAKCKRKRPRTSSPARERNSMAFPPSQEYIEPDAEVIPFGRKKIDGPPRQADGVSQGTGNPF